MNYSYTETMPTNFGGSWEHAETRASRGCHAGEGTPQGAFFFFWAGEARLAGRGSSSGWWTESVVVVVVILLCGSLQRARVPCLPVLCWCFAGPLLVVSHVPRSSGFFFFGSRGRPRSPAKPLISRK